MGNRPAPTGCKFSPSVACGDSSLVRGSQGDGGTTGARDLPPPLPPLRGTKGGGLPLRPSSKKKRVYGRNMVPPVRSRAARFAVPPGVSAETPAIERGCAERMRSGGVVGRVQEKVTCDRKPAPIRHPQPLSQGLRPCQLPLHRGAKPCGGRGLLLCRSQAQRGTRRLRILLKKSVSPQFCPGQRVSGAFFLIKTERGLLRSIICAAIPFDLSLLLKKIRRAR